MVTTERNNRAFPPMRSGCLALEWEEIMRSCAQVALSLNRDLGLEIFEPDVLNFDVLAPFLFSELGVDERWRASRRLGVYRRIIQNFNDRQREEESALLSLFIAEKLGVAPISMADYCRLSSARNCDVHSLLGSYIVDTRRVFYRFDMMDEHPRVVRGLRLLSAFLLFDDDVYDLGIDLARGKRSVLGDYLVRRRGNLGMAVEEMQQVLSLILALYPNEFLLLDFTRKLTGIYQ